MNDNALAKELLVVSFYKFVTLADFESRRLPLQKRCDQLGIRGTILLAHEGINGTVAGPHSNINDLLQHLRRDPQLSDLEHKESTTTSAPFLRMKVRLKKEIVTMGVSEVDPAMDTGTYVDAHQWNELVRDPEVVVIDTRNDYEVELGQFPSALNPETKRFGDLPQWLAENDQIKSKPTVAMYCTGGIRCEKSTALLKQWGYDSVVHLKGGILKYLETVDEDDNLFEGECFVFDERVSVTSDLKKGSYILCRACRMPVSEQQTRAPEFEQGISCPNCYSTLTEERRERLQQRQLQTELARARNSVHIGASYSSRSARKAEKLPILYSFRRCPYAMRARMALSISAQHCQIREIVLRDKPSAMIEASTKGEVPVLVLPDRVVDQSLEIMDWSLNRSDPQGWLIPENGSAQQMHALISRCDGDFKFHLDRYKYASRYDGAFAEDHRVLASVFVQRLHSRLLAGEYLFGCRPCLADIAIFPFIRQFANTDRTWFDEQPWQRVGQWLDGLTASDLFKQIMHKYTVWEDGDPVVVFPTTTAAAKT